jgi:hypothetical protein
MCHRGVQQRVHGVGAPIGTALELRPMRPGGELAPTRTKAVLAASNDLWVGPWVDTAMTP